MLSLRSTINKVIAAAPTLLSQQKRNTFILKRKWPPPLHKKGGKPSKLRARHFVYDLVEDTNLSKQPDIKVILNQFVDELYIMSKGNHGSALATASIPAQLEPPGLFRDDGKRPDGMTIIPWSMGRALVWDATCVDTLAASHLPGVGNAGDVLSLRPTIAYRDFLMPGLAVYASPENVEKHSIDENKPKIESKFSSPYVQRTMGCLSRLVLQITMSKTQPWTLEPWHVRVSFRKAGFIVPEHAINMPPITIKGPDLSLQDKEFIVTVKINNKEEVNVRCRIHHWATGLERLPWVPFHWKEPKEPLLPEQAPILESLPLHK